MNSAPAAASAPARRLLVVLGPLLWLVAAGLLVWIGVTGQRVTDKHILDELSTFVSFGVFVAVGSVLTWRQPTNVVGRLLSIVGLSASLVYLATAYASLTLQQDPTSRTGWLAALTAEIAWLPMLAVAVVYLPLVFPDGRLLGPRWHVVRDVCTVALVTGSVAVAVAPTTYVGEAGYGFAVDNPLAADRALQPLVGAVQTVSVATAVTTVVFALASLALRYRRADRTSRRQIGWVLYAAASSVLLMTVADHLAAVPSALLTSVTLAAVPTAILVAVTRYRLYEIDRLVNRTLVYVTLTAALVALYASGTITLQVVVRPLTGSSELAVAGSTLAVAGAVAPLRRRIQATVDRRFDRARYDAAVTIERFAVRLRGSIDLDQIDHELCAVVSSTLTTGPVSLWLREPSAR